MAEFDWSRFVVRIDVKADPVELYDAWATRDGIERWFLRLSEYKDSSGKIRNGNERVSVGDSYRWLWHGWPDEIEEHGEILEANGKDRFAFRFGNAGNCRVSIFKQGEYQLVEMIQENIPLTEEAKFNFHAGCKEGWTFHLTNMKSIFENGFDLKNKDLSVKGLVNR